MTSRQQPVDIDHLVDVAVAAAPPLTSEQRAALASLLPPVPAPSRVLAPRRTGAPRLLAGRAA